MRAVLLDAPNTPLRFVVSGNASRRREIQVLLEEMRNRKMHLTRRGEPVRAPSNFVHGVLSVGMAVEA